MTSPALKKYTEALSRFVSGENHTNIMRVAVLGNIAGLPQSQVEADILQHMPRAPIPATEVSDAIKKAYKTDYSSAPMIETKSVMSAFKSKTRTKFIELGEGVTEFDWKDISKISIPDDPSWKDAVVVLESLWKKDEILFLGDRDDDQVYSVKTWMDRIADKKQAPPLLIPNPMTGDVGITKNGTPSYRCDDSVKSFRYALAEFDSISKEEQLAFWWGFKSAPIVALVDSGGKSIHAWLKVDCANRDEWEKEVENNLFKNILVPLGCDRACKNESRLSRLAGHFRAEKNNWQRLLYLNPEGGAR